MACPHSWEETGNTRTNPSTGRGEFEVKCKECNETKWVEY